MHPGERVAGPGLHRLRARELQHRGLVRAVPGRHGRGERDSARSDDSSRAGAGDMLLLAVHGLAVHGPLPTI